MIKSWLIIVSGGAITLLGLILIPVPGPGGIPVTIAGLAILSRELPWAGLLMKSLKNRMELLRPGKRID